MTNETTLPELPEPAAWENRSALSSEVRYTRIPVQSLQPGVFTHVKLFTADQMRAYAQQATADLRAELEQCRADTERLDSRMIAITGRDEFGDPQRAIHYDIDLRAAIDAARGAK